MGSTIDLPLTVWGIMKRVISVALVALLSGSSWTSAIAVSASNTECTITGNQSSQTLFGTPEDDVICGMGGNDIVYGLEGDDVILGGDGNDFLDGGAGQDIIRGDAGADSLFGQSAVDQLFGGSGDDSLNGGAGVDILSGDAGVDICVNFSRDKFSKTDCFYDRAVPSIKSIGFSSSNPKVNLYSSGTSLELRVLVSDPGSGMKSIEVGFAPSANKYSIVSKPWSVIRDATITCNSIIEANLAREPELHLPVTNCLETGTPNLGQYRLAVNVPQGLPKAEFSVEEIRIEDQAQNVQRIEGAEVARKKLQTRFTQTGVVDRTAPKLTGAQIVGTKIVRNVAERVVARISFTDAGSNSVGRFWMSFDVPESGYAKDPGFSQWVEIRKPLKSCPEVELVWDPCLYSGSAAAGVLQFYLDVNPALHDIRFLWKAQKLVPRDYSIEDLRGNQYQGRLSSSLVSALTYYKGFAGSAPEDDNDFDAPVLVDFGVDKPEVDTAETAQEVIATLTLKDTGAGLNIYTGNVYLDLAMESGPSVACSLVGSAKGSTTQATYTFKCVLDAHLAAGTYGFHLNAGDMSLRANSLLLGPAQIVIGGRVISVQNG